MNCKRAKTQLALLIGNDLEPVAVQEVRKHLDECGSCREHLQRLSASLDVLQAPVNSTWNTQSESLWPKLSVRLASQGAPSKAHRMNGWAASLSVAAACTAMFLVARHQFPSESVSPPQERIDLKTISGPPIQPLHPFLRQLEERSQPRRSDDDFELRSDRIPDSVPVIPVYQSR
jgi:hypothetical protein